jgi:hypothetical protein
MRKKGIRPSYQKLMTNEEKEGEVKSPQDKEEATSPPERGG